MSSVSLGPLSSVLTRRPSRRTSINTKLYGFCLLLWERELLLASRAPSSLSLSLSFFPSSSSSLSGVHVG